MLLVFEFVVSDIHESRYYFSMVDNYSSKRGHYGNDSVNAGDGNNLKILAEHIL